MFICEKCLDKYRVDSFMVIIAPRSRGNCEDCGERATCYDIHHSRLERKGDK